MVRMRFVWLLPCLLKKSYLSSWVFTTMQSVYIRVNSSLSPPPQILDPPMVASMCSIECSWLLSRSRAYFQSKIPFQIRKCAHLVISAHISPEVKHFTQVCKGEKQSQLLSTTSPLWFWRQIRLVVHFFDKILSFLCFGTSCFTNDFSSQCQKEPVSHFNQCSHIFFRLARGPRDR